MKLNDSIVESTSKLMVTERFSSLLMHCQSSHPINPNHQLKIMPLTPFEQSPISSIKLLVTPFQICFSSKPSSHINPGVQKNGIQPTQIFLIDLFVSLFPIVRNSKQQIKNVNLSNQRDYKNVL